MNKSEKYSEIILLGQMLQASASKMERKYISTRTRQTRSTATA